MPICCAPAPPWRDPPVRPLPASTPELPRNQHSGSKLFRVRHGGASPLYRRAVQSLRSIAQIRPRLRCLLLRSRCHWRRRSPRRCRSHQPEPAAPKPRTALSLRHTRPCSCERAHALPPAQRGGAAATPPTVALHARTRPAPCPATGAASLQQRAAAAYFPFASQTACSKCPRPSQCRPATCPRCAAAWRGATSDRRRRHLRHLRRKPPRPLVRCTQASHKRRKRPSGEPPTRTTNRTRCPAQTRWVPAKV
mmetsp:Transcript_19728/g.54252  ORF Transcript_19728/g.54252 Transcript_19728/m.54252 type:complete len:251 (-) Transcript_19728:2236-2988(-)